MSLNDSEIDVMLRRYAKVGNGVNTGDHLDADELNAFAAGALPAAARSHYMSHLVDCDECRRTVTELAAASGRFDQVSVPTTQSTKSWWQKIGSLFALSRLRYAAFAAVLIAVMGIGYGIWRKTHERPSALIAQNERAASENLRTAPQSQPSVATGGEASQSPTVVKAIPQPTPMQFVDQKRPETTAVSPPPPPKEADALAKNGRVTSSPATEAANVGSANAVAPSYAPAPSLETERADTRNREPQNLSLLHGPQRGESNEKYKTIDDRSRGANVAKARDEDNARVQTDQPVAKEEPKDEERAARKRSESKPATLTSRSGVIARQEETKSDKAGPPAEADTRSVGGRKFKRQGNEWVDVKLKPSMSVTLISRGSEDFEKLDSSLRSISQQFSGPVVVVWKGKAYRIQ